MLPATHHAQLRAKERLGFSPTERDWQDALLAITDTASGAQCTAMLQARTGHNAEIWRVKLAGHEVSVVYIPETATIITVMSRDMSRGQHLIRRYGKRMG